MMNTEERYKQAIKELVIELVANKHNLQNVLNCNNYYEASKINTLFNEIVDKVDTKYNGLTGFQVSEAFRLFKFDSN